MAESPIGQRLKFLIAQLGLEIPSFSKAIGVGDTTVRNYFNRGSKPNAEFFEKLTNTFESVNLSWLLTGRGEPFLPTDSQNTSTQFDAKKISRSQVIANNQGNSSINSTDLEKDLAAANEKIALLNSQLADKERTIQILLKQQS